MSGGLSPPRLALILSDSTFNNARTTYLSLERCLLLRRFVWRENVAAPMRPPERAGRAADRRVGGAERRPQLVDRSEQHASDQQTGAYQKQHQHQLERTVLERICECNKKRVVVVCFCFRTVLRPLNMCHIFIQHLQQQSPPQPDFSMCNAEMPCNQLPVACIICTFNHSCIYGRELQVNCEARKMVSCAVSRKYKHILLHDDHNIPLYLQGEREFKRNMLCRYCYQTEDWEHSCSEKDNCNSAYHIYM